MSENKYTAYHVMGMRCIKCRVEIGALLIPDSTPEEFSASLMARKIYPICNNCERKNPRRVSAENVRDLQ